MKKNRLVWLSDEQAFDTADLSYRRGASLRGRDGYLIFVEHGDGDCADRYFVPGPCGHEEAFQQVVKPFTDAGQRHQPLLFRVFGPYQHRGCNVGQNYGLKSFLVW